HHVPQVPEDLTGKMFTFPRQTNTAHVKLITTIDTFRAATVCHRSFSDLRRDHALFSLSTTINSNGFLIFWDEGNKELEPHVSDKKLEYKGLDFKLNMWHSICTTWDSTSGLVQLWLDGQPLMKKFVSSTLIIKGRVAIVLGQEQDSHGSLFDLKQSFVGMMTDVHMWDYTLSACEIQKYMDELNFTPGNILNWGALEFQIVERVLIENRQTTCTKL
ncbi:LOW QUALITY PROTEIN: serum amyloid P-component-like, partial [Cottoperca gobio]|uniref:Pentraxin family member n=1 Tax=Cottoperca gobio TaxID=56716 RepID=A0A6J2RCI1_COTGO